MNFIQEYQRFHNLKDDGVLGPKTISTIMEDLGISSISSMSHFLGQCHHESMAFSRGRENLSYSENALKSYFSKYFKEDEYSLFAHKPEEIANRIYSNRMGNGNEDSGQGWLYRGIGPIQLTGYSNISSYFDSVGLPKDSNPNLILQPQHYFRSAKYFFDKNNIWKFTTATNYGNILTVSKAINLGDPYSSKIPIGITERDRLTQRYYKILSSH